VPDATRVRAKRELQENDFGEYRLQSRGGKGIITMKTNEKTEVVIGALTLRT